MATGALTRRPAAEPGVAAAEAPVVALAAFGWPERRDDAGFRDLPTRFRDAGAGDSGPARQEDAGFRDLPTPLRVPAAGFVLREEPPRPYSWPNFDPTGPDSTAPDTFDCGLAPEGLLHPRRRRNLPTEIGDAEAGRHRSADRDGAPESEAITAPAAARDFREELTAIVKTVVRDAAGALAADTFVAYYRVDGGPSRSMRRIADAARDRGCRTPPSRERVRRAAIEGREVLARAAGRVRFRHWGTAVSNARERTPQPLPAFLSHFGYRPGSPRPAEIGETLRRMAALFGLAFPFRFRATARDLWVTPDDPDEADAVVGTVRRLDALPSAPWYEWREVTRGRTGGEAARLRRVLEASARWSFLDPPERYFWRRPPLPPKHPDNVGNSVFSALCRVFSVGVEARAETIRSALARTRALQGRPVPEPVLLGIAAQSGLFEVTSGRLRRPSGVAWFPPTRFDLALARLSATHGRLLPRAEILAALRAAGATRDSARVKIARSPLLLPARPADRSRSRLYRFLFAPRHLFLPEPATAGMD